MKSPLRKSKTQHMASPTKTSKSSMSKENSISPVKDQISTGLKENSPIKRSKNKRKSANLENIESPTKSSLSPQKRSKNKEQKSLKKSLRKAISDVSPEKTSPLKK